MFRLFRCGNNNAIDERANRPNCFGDRNHVIIHYDPRNVASSNDGGAEEFNIQKPTKEKSELDKLIDIIEASETANETETDEEEEWDMSYLVGESLLTNYSPDTVNTKDALNGKTLVLLYFGGGDAKTLEMLKLFDAGYHHSVMSVLYCHDDLSAFVDMPARWFAALNVAEVNASLDVIEENCLLVIDPTSGDILCNDALDNILALDSSDAAVYDEQATQLFQSWIQHLPVQQSVIGEMTFELREPEADAATQETVDESEDESEDESKDGESNEDRVARDISRLVCV